MKAMIHNKLILGEYLLLCLQGLKTAILSLIDDSAHGTKCIKTESFERMTIPLPEKDEQLKVVTAVHEKLKKLDTLLTKQTEAITLLKERRSALISAAVTGKIDVRDWQPPKDVA